MLTSSPGHSANRRPRQRHLLLEQLESRTPLAADVSELPPDGYQAAVKLEIVDLDGNLITQISVGGDFRLQARFLVPAGRDPFSAYADFTFLSEFVAPVPDVTDLGVRQATFLAGEIDEAGRIMYWTPSELIISKKFRALAEGTATFGSNAAENPYFDMLYTLLETPLDLSTISFGSVDLEILASDSQPVVPEPPYNGPRKLDFQLELLAEEYAQHQLSGSTQPFYPSSMLNQNIYIVNDHVLIVAFNKPWEQGPGTDEEFAIFADELREQAGVVNLVNAWGFIRGWIPLERIRDLNLVDSLVLANPMPRELIATSPPIPDTPPAPTPPPIETPVEEPAQPVAEIAATIVIEIVNMAGEVVERVSTNEDFMVRARLVVASGAAPVAAYIDLAFTPGFDLSTIAKEEDLGAKFSYRIGDELKELGRVMYYDGEPDLIFAKVFRAGGVGELTFTTNPGDYHWDEILYIGLDQPLLPAQVQFGSATVLVELADDVDESEAPPISEVPIAQVPTETPSTPEIPAVVTPGPISILPVHFDPTDPSVILVVVPPPDATLPFGLRSVTIAPDARFLVEGSVVSAEALPTFLLPVTQLRAVAASNGRDELLTLQLVSYDSLPEWQLVANPTASDDVAVAAESEAEDSTDEPSLCERPQEGTALAPVLSREGRREVRSAS